MQNTQTETDDTNMRFASKAQDKAPTATEISIQSGISLLKTEEPADRGEAFKVLKKADLTGGGKWFNNVIKGYELETGITLEKSEKAAAKALQAKAMKWAHNASEADVVSLAARAAGKGQQFWAAWKLNKEGKWPNIDAETTFVQHFKKQELDESSLINAIAILKEATPTTRGEAFNLLKDTTTGKVDSQIYTIAVASYENASGTTLSQSTKAQEEAALNASVHAMSASEVREHIAGLEEPDAIFWKAWQNAKEGAWDGDITRGDFTPLFINKDKGQASDKAQPQQAKETNKAAIEMDDDIPF